LVRDSNEKTPARIKIQSFFWGVSGRSFRTFFLTGALLGARGPLWVRFVLFWEPSGLPLGAFGSTFAVRRILHFIWGFIRLSAARVLSWPSWPPSGCLGPVPLALRGRSEGPASLAHGNAFSVFLINDAFFPRPSFFKLPRGSKGGPGTTLEHFYDHLRLQMDPSRAPFRSETPPETT